MTTSTPLIPLGFAKLQLTHDYTQLPDFFYRPHQTEGFASPEFIFCNHPLAHSYGLNEQELFSPKGAQLLSGSSYMDQTQPIAQAYAGHQFGHYNRLGDGRALLLGEFSTPHGLRDLHLKGSGRTPYSRGGDGRASVGPMLRECLISEFMAAMNIPTTRCLAVTSTGETVLRQQQQHGAVLARTAQSHIRVGTFELTLPESDPRILQQLVNYTLQRHGMQNESSSPFDSWGAKALRLLQQTIQRQAQRIAQWMSVGFIHGVMNTDNMLISGETIDYGPCAFLDAYGLNTKFSSIDHGGRYAFGQQAPIALWNLSCLAQTLLPLWQDEQKDRWIEEARSLLQGFLHLYQQHHDQLFLQKLGLPSVTVDGQNLLKQLLIILEEARLDFNESFLSLTDGLEGKIPLGQLHPALHHWHQNWVHILHQQTSTNAAIHLMRRHNPLVIPRNHQVEHALDQAEFHQNFEPFRTLLQALQSPFEDTPARRILGSPPQETNPHYRTFCGT